jgi:hypothetical protein
VSLGFKQEVASKIDFRNPDKTIFATVKIPTKNKRINLSPSGNATVYTIHSIRRKAKRKCGCHCHMAAVWQAGHFPPYSVTKLFVNRAGNYLRVATSQCPLCVTSHLYLRLLLFFLVPLSSP